jgi:ornithine cyclodeaminase
MATAAARDALVQAASGELASPPRVAVDLPTASPLFTVGASATAHGFRVYDRRSTEDDQLTAVWHGPRLLGTVTGPELGSRRTGSLGAVAADLLAPAGALEIGLVGAGRQAWAQVWALSALRPIASVRVFSRNPEQRQSFADRLGSELSIDAHTAVSAQVAVGGAPVVIIATSSREPVVEVAWLRDARHVSTVGPKLAHAHEWPIQLADWAELIATDAPDELHATESHLLAGTPHAGRVQGVGNLILDGWTRERPEMRTLYLSTGLPGSEVILAERVLLTAGEG